MDLSPTVRVLGPVSDTVQSVLQLCLPYLNLVAMVRLSSCSLQVASFCRSQLSTGNNGLAHALLHAAVTDAAGLELFPTGKGSKQRKQNVERQLQQFKQAVVWLADAMGSKPLFNPAGIHSAAQTALVQVLVQRGTPVVPLELAVRLVQSGLRVSYSELVSAARAGVSGIGLWPKAMLLCGVTTDIPAWAKYAALGTYEWSEVWVPIDTLSAQELTAYMFLVANGLPGSNDGVPKRTRNMQLYQMSLILQHSAAHGVTANDIVGLMKLAARRPGVNWEHSLQFFLCKLPGAAGITAQQVGEPGNGLLELGVRQSDGFLVECCLRLIPAGKDIAPDAIVRCLKVLIEAAASGRRVKAADQLHAEPIPRMLVSSAPAERLSPVDAEELVQNLLTGLDMRDMKIDTRRIKVDNLLEQIVWLPSFRRIEFTARLDLMAQASRMGMHRTEFSVATSYQS